MKPWVAVCGFVLLVGSSVPTATDSLQGEASFSPTTLPASAIQGVIGALPPEASFDISGLAYFNGKLFATSNIGLIELEGGSPSRLIRFHPQFSVVSGPWVDSASGMLWIRDDQTFELIRYDGTDWRRSRMPRPEKGTYSRGDVLANAPLVPHAGTMWMLAGGSLWRGASEPPQWQLFSLPQPQLTGDRADEPLGMLSIDGAPGLIVRNESLAFLVRDGQDFNSDTVLRYEDGWKPISSPKDYKFLTERWTSASGAGYICTRTGDLLQVRTAGVRRLDAPGRCETVTTSSDGKLLTSLRRTGVYEFQDSWIMRSKHPHTAGGDYWTYLAGKPDEVAIVVRPRPVIDPSIKIDAPSVDIRFIRNAQPGFWLIRGQDITAVKIGAGGK